jgi:eukaryotic-like serine/threonine-protein kinase
MKNGYKLGEYEIVSKIGEGGMGEVYRARDKSLGRDVAIKVLPKAFSSDEDRLRRFELEAQAAGSLNHPNVLVIYHVGVHDEAPYIVSELLEGETLRERIAGQPLPQRKALDYALQIAHGLAAAHEKGIVHRDLKPENIFITRDGRVKILDFGLAKLTQPAEAGSLTDLPTRKLQTDPGTVMGTIAYMSPEQVRARPLDHRTDIFSFGVILYEMLTGKMAFHGDSTADLMSAILREDPPPLSSTNSALPPSLERVVDHCLEKNPEERFHSASDLAFAIEALSATSLSSIASVDPTGFTKKRNHASVVVWALAALLLMTSAGLGYLLWSRNGTDVRQTRFVVPIPANTEEVWAPIISPDGRTLAFVGSFEGKNFIFTRPFDIAEPQRLAGTDGAGYPFWSPDSRSLAFFADGKLKKIDLAGGSALTICDARQGNGGSWNSEGVIIFGMFDHGVHRVAASGGAPSQVLEVDKDGGEVDHTYPVFLPDDRHFVYLSWRGLPNNAEIWIAALDGSARKSLMANNSNTVFADKYLLFARGTTVMAQEFDTSTLSLLGEPFPVQENVMFQGSESYSNFSVSPSGVLAYKGGGGANRQLVWFDRSGKKLSALDPAGTYNDVELSPDDRWAAVQRLDGENSAIWVFDLTRDTASRFTLLNANEDDPVWTADGKYMIFSASTPSPRIFRKLANGAGGEELLANIVGGLAANGLDVDRDGRALIFERTTPQNASDLWILPLDGSGEPYPFLASPFSEFHGKFSPDGRWLAYSSTESGRAEVFVRSFPGNEGKWPVSTGGGAQPRWRSDGKELFFLNPERQLMSVGIKHGQSLEIGTPAPLFRTQISGHLLPNRYDVSSDGQRFLINSSVEGNESAPMFVTINWLSGIKK